MENPGHDVMVPSPPDAAPFATCERDPIHVPGRIQPYGTLIATDRATGRLTHVTMPLRPDPAISGVTLTDILGVDQMRRLEAEDLKPDRPGLFRTWRATVRFPGRPPLSRTLIAHNTGTGAQARRILEFLPEAPGGSAGPIDLANPSDLIRRLQGCSSVDAVLNVAVQICQEITGFERVMVYRFGPDGHGEVIREASDGPDRFLGHVFPDSDIPPPARALYRRNTIRIIPDVDATPAPIQALEAGKAVQPLDLSHAILRAVAPVHITYLKNMGVRASLSISLMVQGELWGLVLCHHAAPRHCSPMALQILEMLGDVASSTIERLELETRLARLRKAIAVTRDARDAREKPEDGPIAEAILSRIKALCACDGIVGRIAGQPVRHGPGPDAHQLEPILAQQARDRVSFLNGLGNRLGNDSRRGQEPGAIAWGGGAFVPLDAASDDYLFLARRSIVQDRRWGGMPHHDKALGPRRSFETWRERVTDRCKAFEPDLAEVLEIIRQGLNFDRKSQSACAPDRPPQARPAGDDAQRIGNAPEGQRAEHLAAMGDLASGLAHELNQPLSSIINYAATCNLLLGQANAHAAAASDSATLAPLVETMLDEAKRAGEIVRRLRRFMQTGTFEPALIDLTETVRLALKLALTPDQRAGLRVAFDAPREGPFVLADDVQIQQVVFNLIRNACDAMTGQAERLLDLRIEGTAGDFVTVRVMDNGPGITDTVLNRMFDAHVTTKTDGMGIGLSLSRSIVQAHGGTMGAHNHATGAEVFFSLPLAPEEALDDQA